MLRSHNSGDSLPLTAIADLRPFGKNCNVVFIVLDKLSVTRTKDDRAVTQVLVADHSGCIYLSLWDQLGDVVQVGDIFRLVGGYCTLFKNQLTLYSGPKGTLERIGEFTMLFNESLNMSTMQWVQDHTTKAMVPVLPSSPGAFVGTTGTTSRLPSDPRRSL
eukprot:GILJ01005506.1.p1 GENE.GILJ01005506.1~~GILJ01005506.1.p1  ORF type:complete len:161 (+),score=15.62 GILJ01005506.1:40-522(+)